MAIFSLPTALYSAHPIESAAKIGYHGSTVTPFQKAT